MQFRITTFDTQLKIALSDFTWLKNSFWIEGNFIGVSLYPGFFTDTVFEIEEDAPRLA